VTGFVLVERDLKEPRPLLLYSGGGSPPLAQCARKLTLACAAIDDVTAWAILAAPRLRRRGTRVVEV
jgi:hypothetical protein